MRWVGWCLPPLPFLPRRTRVLLSWWGSPALKLGGTSRNLVLGNTCIYTYTHDIYIYIYCIYIYICDHPTVRLLMMGAYRHQHASLLLIMASAKKDVPMAEDMSRYAQYLQQPARCATFQGFENFPQLTVIKDF